MRDYVEWISRIHGAALPGASEDDLRSFAKVTGLSLPPDLRAFYAAANGFDLGWLHILPLDDVANLVDLFDTSSSFAGYIPFVDHHSPDHYCLCSRPPLQGHIVSVRANDSPVLLFRSLGTFLTAIECAEGNASKIDLHADHALARNDQLAEDDVRARDLLRLGRSMSVEDPGRIDALRFAVVLLQPESIDELLPLLDEDVFVRADVLARLKGIGTLQARAVFATFQADLAAFVEQAVGALRGAGLTVAEVKEDHVQVETDVGVDLAPWFGKRRDPEVLAEIVALTRQLICLEQGNEE